MSRIQVLLPCLIVAALLAVRGVGQGTPGQEGLREGHGSDLAGPPAPSRIIALSDENEARIKAATRAVLCYCGCAPTLVDECICGTALALKDDMRSKLLSGWTPKAMVDDYIAQYGERYLAAPPKEGFNLVIWFFPAVAFVGLSLLFWALMRRLTRGRQQVVRPQATGGTKGVVERYGDEIERAVSERSHTP